MDTHFNVYILIGSLLPLIGTTIGAMAVYFLKSEINKRIQINLCLLAAGVMFAASVWGLIIPSISASARMGIWSFVPCVTGIILGTVFFVVIEKFIPEKGKIMPLAVAIHNVPEGMAVGVALAGSLSSVTPLASAFALSLGIAVQNIPEGAIISMPLYSQGKSKHKCFALGVLSGVVEPIFSVITILLAGLITPIMPYLMSFAAGCMIYVCVKELLPQLSADSGIAPVFSFVTGFLVMLILDVALS